MLFVYLCIISSPAVSRMNQAADAKSENLCCREECIYTTCYCEENVWKLAETVAKKRSDFDKLDLYVVFISNNSRMIPVFCQSKAENPDEPLVWDYHVVAVHKDRCRKSSFLYDFDSVLSFPEDFNNYVEKAIRDEKLFQSKFHRLFRVIPAKYYLENFASNRSHMIIDASTDTYSSAPPSYPCIESKTSKNNIQEFINMQKRTHGTIMNHAEFVKFFNDFS